MMTTMMMMMIRTITVLADACVIAIPCWVFFLQSPLLFGFLGRDKFISPMMRLTKLLFRWTLPIAAAIAAMGSFYLAVVGKQQQQLLQQHYHTTATFLCSTLSLVAVLINAIWVVPKALEAGKRATRTADQTQSAKDFAVHGGHQSDTRTLHQTVVLFVVIMLVGAVGHVHCIVNHQHYH